MSIPPAAITVYYDGSCPMCAREIGFYRRQRGADTVAWVDVSEPGDATPAPDLTRDVAMARFHVRTADGRLVDGGEAFAHLWSALPAFRPAGRLARLPVFLWPLDRVYNAFLRVRPLLQRFAASRSRDSCKC